MLFEVFFIFSLSSQKTNGSSTTKKIFHISDDCFDTITFNNRISNYNSLCFYNCTFNSIRNQEEQGGAIYILIQSNTNIIENCIFTLCEGKEGGAIYIKCQSLFDVKFINCLFESNQGIFGGCIYCQKTNISFDECTFNNNLGKGSIEPSTISYVTYFKAYGGCIYFNESISTLKECKFKNNSIYTNCDLFNQNNVIYYSYGGCIYSIQSNLLIFQCDFEKNIAYSKSNSYECYSYGGAISIESSVITINKSNFNHNLAFSSNNYRSDSNSFGGAIMIFGNASLFECMFNVNTVESNSISTTTQSGAVCLNGDFLEVTKCVFNNNLAKSDNGISNCGAMSATCKSATLIFCSFYNNTCISFSNITSDAKGGAILMSADVLKIDCCNFTNNTANCIGETSTSQTCGGAMFYYLMQGMDVSIVNCIFINNLAKNNNSAESKSHGGAVYINNWHIPKIKSIINNCTFQNNIAMSVSRTSFIECYGGGIYSYVYSYIRPNLNYTIEFHSCKFFNNSCIGKYLKIPKSRICGGALFIDRFKNKIISCIFSNNSAYDQSSVSNSHVISGVAIYFYSNEMIVQSCDFENNSMFSNSLFCGYGGAIFIEYSSDYLGHCTLIEKCNFINNCFDSNNRVEGCDLYFISNATVKFCNFIINQKNGCNSIYLNVSTPIFLNIEDCNFDVNLIENSIQKSLISFSIYLNNLLVNSFTNNQIFITNSKNYYVFNGTSKSRWKFDNNCILPYESVLFKKDGSTQVYDENGNKIIEFEEAFVYECILPTDKFTKSSQFTYSLPFSPSHAFTKSLQFTPDENIHSNSFNSYENSAVYSNSMNSFENSAVHSDIMNSYENSNVFTSSVFSNEKIENKNKSKNKFLTKNRIVIILIIVEMVVIVVLIIVILILVFKTKRRRYHSDELSEELL